jgi:hypothetical protein
VQAHRFDLGAFASDDLHPDLVHPRASSRLPHPRRTATLPERAREWSRVAPGTDLGPGPAEWSKPRADRRAHPGDPHMPGSSRDLLPVAPRSSAARDSGDVHRRGHEDLAELGAARREPGAPVVCRARRRRRRAARSAPHRPPGAPPGSPGAGPAPATMTRRGSRSPSRAGHRCRGPTRRGGDRRASVRAPVRRRPAARPSQLLGSSPGRARPRGIAADDTARGQLVGPGTTRSAASGSGSPTELAVGERRRDRQRVHHRDPRREQVAPARTSASVQVASVASGTPPRAARLLQQGVALPEHPVVLLARGR